MLLVMKDDWVDTPSASSADGDVKAREKRIRKVDANDEEMENVLA
jgi:hypothetical protein